MNTVRIRLVGDETCTETLMNMLHEVSGVEYVEALPLFDARLACGILENGDGLDTESSVCNLEVEVTDASAAHRIRIFTAGAAMLMDASAEFVEQF